MHHSKVPVTLDTDMHIGLQDVCEKFARNKKGKSQ